MLGALLILGCLPLSLIMGIIGIVLDRPRWLAITIVVLVTVIGLLVFGMPILFSICS